MSYERVKQYFESIGLPERITEHDSTGDTVEHAAQVIGCAPAEIAKTLSFLVDGKPVMVVMAGDAKVNSSKFKAKFRQKPSMVPREEVERLIGHKPGGVCPFANPQDVRTFLDVSLQRFDTVFPALKRFIKVHTAAGIDMATLWVSLAELEQYSGASEWVDVCNGWQENKQGGIEHEILCC